MKITTLLSGYKSFLEKKYSKVTIKNYLSDLNHFVSWSDNYFKNDFSIESLDKSVIQAYEKNFGEIENRKQSKLSYRSLKRHISTIKTFTAYAVSEGLLSLDPFNNSGNEEKPSDNWDLKEFKNFLYERGSSQLTIKFYINDIQSFSKWISQVYPSSIPNSSSIHPISEDIISEYSNRLEFVLHLAPKSINRKLSSIRRYLHFLKSRQQIYIETAIPNVAVRGIDQIRIEDLLVSEKPRSYSTFPPLRFLQKLATPYLLLEGKIAEKLSHKVLSSSLKNSFIAQENFKNPKLFDRMLSSLQGKNISKEFYAPSSMAINSLPARQKIIFHLKHTRPQWYKRYHSYPFVHYVHFAILTIVAVSASIYFYSNTIGSAGAQNNTQNSMMNKTFVFKGKLLDKNGNPITAPSDIRLGLYSSPTASGSALLWQETQHKLKADSNGDITIIIGNTDPIPMELFNNNTPLYLGVTINDGQELTPRKPIGTPFADNAFSLQGLTPITNSSRQANVLLALDASGILTIGGSANPVFQATGGDFTLSGQTLVLITNPSSNGNIVLNPDGNGRIDFRKPLINSDSGILGIEGNLSITATTSASPTLLLAQDSAGEFLVASSAGSSRFVIDNQGMVSKGIWAGSPIATEFGGFGANVTPGLPGAILYSVNSNSYGFLKPGIAGQCLTSNGYAAPLWNTCGVLNELNGVITTTSKLDILLGDTSTNSARFAFVNMGSGDPMLKIGNNTTLTGSGKITTNNTDLVLGGDNSKNIILTASNDNQRVGIGTNSPVRTLDVNGNFGGNVDFYQDGANTQTIIRSTKALIYDLEKNTGSEDTSTTTTYNITGLPDTDGTIAYIYNKVGKNVTPASQIQTIVIQINGIQVSSTATPNQLGASTVIKHFTIVRSNNTWHLLGDSGNTDTADVAEWIPTTGNIPQPGDLISFSENGSVTKSSTSYDTRVAGIVSTEPRITIGRQTETSVRMALSGRIPTIVTSMNGVIQIGDSITSSPIPGIGMKPSITAPIVGKAMENFIPNESCPEVSGLDGILWPTDNGTNKNHPCFKVKVLSLPAVLQEISIQKYGASSSDYIYVGKIMVMASLSWSDSTDLIASIDSVNFSSEDTAPNSVDPELLSELERLQTVTPAVEAGEKAIKKVGAYSAIAAGKIKAGILTAGTVATQNFTAGTARIQTLTVKALNITDSITFQGATLKDYIASTIDQKNQHIVSPLAEIKDIKTNTISPLDGDTVLVKGNLSAENASVSGALTSKSFTNEGDASVSGTLRAGTIIANNISGLDDKVGTLAAELQRQASIPKNVPSSILSLSSNQASMSASFGTFYDGLLSLGASTFGNLSVMDQLSIGTSFIFSEHSINALGADLELQPLRQGGISFLAGLIKISSDGQLVVSENAEFLKSITARGGIKTNIISPLPGKDLSINNASNSAVFTVNNNGDVVASGSGTFSKLKFSVVGQAIASGPLEATATGSAGLATLKANTTELTIKNPLVTADSLIYVTPAQDTTNQVLYLLRQVPNESFTVGISSIINKDVQFNWLIVN